MKHAFVSTALILAVTLPGYSFSAAELSDAAAHQIATRMEQTVSLAEVNLLKAVKADDRGQYAAVVAPVHAALKAWPADHLDNRASFPYWGCKQMAASFLQIADGWRRADGSKTWRAHATQNLKADTEGCRAALRSPDLSLKEIK